MTTTEKIRRLLDERGVEWKESEFGTTWGKDGVHCYSGCYAEDEGDGLYLVFRKHHLTPEQAIEATLGRGECEVEGYDDGLDEGLDGELFAYGEPTWFLSCGHDVCGSERPRFCSECGRRVV